MNQFDIYAADFKYYKDGQAYIESTPILVISDNLYAVLSSKITHHEPRKSNEKYNSDDYSIIDYKGAGLKEPSTIRFLSSEEIPKDKIKYKIGRLQQVDIKRLKNKIKQIKATIDYNK